MENNAEGEWFDYRTYYIEKFKKLNKFIIDFLCLEIGKIFYKEILNV